MLYKFIPQTSFNYSSIKFRKDNENHFGIQQIFRLSSVEKFKRIKAENFILNTNTNQNNAGKKGKKNETIKTK